MSNIGGSEGRPPGGRHVTIAPASLPTASSSRSSADADVNALSGQPTAKLPRRTVTAVACNQCKQRKSKCDGERPVCQACIRRGEQDKCQFDIHSDQRRTAALKEKVGDLKVEGDNLKRVVAVLNSKISPEDPYNPLVNRMVENEFMDLPAVAGRMTDENRDLLVRCGLLDEKRSAPKSEPYAPSEGSSMMRGPLPPMEPRRWAAAGPSGTHGYMPQQQPGYGQPMGLPQPMEPGGDVIMQYDSDRRPLPEGYQHTPSQQGYYPPTSRPWSGPG